jgi:hypothetical protein
VWNPFAAVLRFWLDWTARAFDLIETGEREGARREPEPASDSAPFDRSDLGRADLLSLRMQVLRLDVDQLGSADLWGFRELQRLCAKCESRLECARTLADEFSDPGWQDWRNYCPNATTLSILSALHGTDSAPPAA